MRRSFLLLLVVLAWSASVRAQHPTVQGLVDAVDAARLLSDLRQLSGEDPVDVGVGPQYITSRHRTNPGNALAATWLQQELEGMGYTTTLQSFGSLGGNNILAEKPGAVHPDKRVILCAHYDAMPGGSNPAPAADDDGTGVCAVLEAARLMASLQFENTVVFALWDEEEQGLIGSRYYANLAASNDLDIVGVVNIDMIGYDGNDDRRMRLHARPVANGMAQRDTALAVNELYGIDMDILVMTPGQTYSDHAAFWEQSYGAILLIEDFEADGNPAYHTVNDVVDALDTAYWADVVRVGIGTTAALAVPYDGVGLPEVRGLSDAPLLQVYPNPSDGLGTVRVEVSTSVPVDLQVFDATGRSVGSLFQGVLPRGEHLFQWGEGTSSPGHYVVRCATTSTVRSVPWVRLP